MKISKSAALAVATVAAGLSVGASVSPAAAQCGGASWYALHSRTASGERMNPSALTAINDRGPFVRGRVLDLSRAAASQIGMIGSGHTAVCAAPV